MSAFDPSAFDSGVFDAAPTGAAVLPIAVLVQRVGVAAIPLRVAVGPQGSAESSLDVAVLPPAILSGNESVCAGNGVAAVWAVVVRIDGEDVGSRVIGDIVVEAEEDAARIAELAIKPAAGSPIVLPEWTGRAVTIDIADNATGTPRYAVRLFTGVVDLPTLDLDGKIIQLRCTDDLQGRCLGMAQEDLASVIGGHYSGAVFDAASDGWRYAQDRISTRAASIDISPTGVLRVTGWQAKETADIEFTEDDVGDGSLSVQMADLAGLVNQVSVDFGYRFPRVKAECRLVEYSYLDMTGFATFVLAERWFLQRSAVEAAISSAGGTLENITYTPLPDEPIEVGVGGFWTPGPADGELCLGFSASVSFDYGQTIEERHSIVVEAPNSIAAVGRRAQTMSGALQGRYPELPTVEAGITLYKKDIVAVPPADKAVPELGKTTSAEVTLTEDSNRAAANAAMETLISMAKRTIWASHRGNTVSFTVPLNPAVDLDKTVGVTACGVTAKGKVRRVVHRMSPETGAAVSDVSLAICAAAGVGIVHDETPTAAPDGTAPASTDVSGAVGITYNSGPAEDHTITVVFPEVSSAERDNAVVNLDSVFLAPMVEDVFTITF